VREKDLRPRWVRDLTRFLPLKSQFVLTGNVRDLQIRDVGGTPVAAPLSDLLAATLCEAGYADFVRYDPLAGFVVLARPDGPQGDANGVLTRLGLTPSNGRAPPGPDLFGTTLERLVGSNGPPVALVADFASRLIVRSDALTQQEQALFTRALVLSQSAEARPVEPGRAPRYNCVIWIAEREGDLPDWLTIVNPRLRHIPVAPPDRSARYAVAPSLVRGMPGARDAGQDVVDEAVADLADANEGILLVDLSAVAQLARPLAPRQLHEAALDGQAPSLTATRPIRAVQGRSRASRNLPYAAPLQPGHWAVSNASRLPLPRRNEPPCRAPLTSSSRPAAPRPR
jgi:hypothetical protein